MSNNIKNSFSSYDPDSEDITLEYHLTTENTRYSNIDLTLYKKEFGKFVNTDNFIKFEKFKKTN